MELMVGVAVGLIIVAGAAMVTTTQLTDTSQLTREMQVQQDLRAAADLVARALRQSGSWPAAATSIWTPALGPAAVMPANPYSAITTSSSSVAFFGTNADPAAGINYVSNPTTKSVQFRLNTATGALQALLGGAWQDITDPYSLVVTSFSVAKTGPGGTLPASIQLKCGAPCAAGGTACWPSFEINEYRVAITGHAKADAKVVREVVTNVRLRNDKITNNNPPPPLPPGPLCPT
ncbi:MAG: hypothetical protein KGL43_11255 [Burkholderiales bacterium]|nr:hypothetical protein [Burkholderiales bacterium]MDE2395863.1 hypothetical protein [Burkholderiales bacterium]MDE2454159.1 hypothetical protein [Burkholderiales bacterium]